MRPRQSSSHSDAVSRRLEVLSAELRSVNGDPAPQIPAALDDHTRIRPGGPADPWQPFGSGVSFDAWQPPDPQTAEADQEQGQSQGQSLRVRSESRLHTLEEDLARHPTSQQEVVPTGAAGGASPPAVPNPGRHAARRRTRLIDLSALHGRIALTPAHVAVFAVLVAVGLAVTTWWVLRDDADVGQSVARGTATQPLSTPVDAATGGAGDAARSVGEEEPETGANSGEATSTELVVDVAGKVRSPGIVVLEPGSRVADAIDAAGGAKRGVDLTSLNLARVLQDGEQILVGVTPPPGVAATAVPPPEGEASNDGDGGSEGDLININTASATELEELSGVGPVTAAAIIDWRTTNGGFQSVDQLIEVDGIGEKTLATLAPHVTIG